MAELISIEQRREALSLVATADRLAAWFVNSGLVEAVDHDMLPDVDDERNDFELDDRTRPTIKSFWIADGIGAGTARYQVARTGNELFLQRNGRIIVANERVKRFEFSGLDIANGEDSAGLRRALPALVEAAKYPAIARRNKTLRQIDQSVRPDKLILKATVDNVQPMDATVRGWVETSLGGELQIFRDHFEDRDIAKNVLISSSNRELNFDTISQTLSKAQSDFRTQERIVERAGDLSPETGPLLAVVPTFSTPSLTLL